MGSNKNRGGPNPGLLLALIGLVWLFWSHHQNPKETQHPATDIQAPEGSIELPRDTLTTEQIRASNLIKLRRGCKAMGVQTQGGSSFLYRDTVKVYSGEKSFFMMEIWLKPDSFTFVYDVSCTFYLETDMQESQVYLDRDMKKTGLWLEMPKPRVLISIQNISTKEQGFWSAQNWYATGDNVTVFENLAREKLTQKVLTSGEKHIPQRNLSDAWIEARTEIIARIRTFMAPVEVLAY